MQHRSLGKTGLSVSRIGIGLAALGRPGYINLGHEEDLDSEYEIAAMESGAHRVLDAAWECGGRYFDAARSYGRAEAFLSSWLRSRGDEDLTVGSKWGYTYTADWQVDAEAHEVKEHSLTVLERQIQESRELLGDSLDLYQIHSATLESGVLENRDVLEYLAKLKEEGLRIGLSVSGENQSEVIRKAIVTEVDGVSLFDVCQATWNLLETSAGAALGEAHDAGIGIIVKEGVANGRLTSRNASVKFKSKKQTLVSLAEKYDSSIDGIALAAILAQRWADVVLSGAASVEHLRSNVAACGITLETGDLKELESLAENPDEYWAARSALDWN